MPTARQLISPPASANHIVALSHFGFFLIGIVNTMLGPILPYLTARWRLDDSQAGLLLLAQPAAAMLGSLLSGLLVKRFGFTLPLTCGFALMATGVFGLSFNAWAIGLLSIAGTGFGLGLTVPTINLLISEANAQQRASALNILNLVWGLGAASGPLLISALVRVSSFAGALLVLAALIAAMTLLMSRSQASAPSAASFDRSAAAPVKRAGLSSYLFLTCVLVFINVGTESATGGWIATYVQRLSDAANFSWSLAPSVFWAGLLVGRAVAPLVLRHVTETKTILAGMIVAVCGMLIILWSSEAATVFVGIGLAGFGLGPVFPTTFALFTQRFGSESAHLTGILFLLAGLGSALFPLAVGLLSSHFDALRAGLFVPLCGGLAMIVLQISIMSLGSAGKERSRPGDIR